MEKLKFQIIKFFNKDSYYQFSKNLWLDLAGHAFIGLTIGILFCSIRDVKAAPVLLLCSTGTTWWGLRNRRRRDAERENLLTKNLND